MKILVTGGAIRIGRAICHTLAHQGHEVVIHCHRSASEAQELAVELEAAGGRAHVVQRALVGYDACDSVVREAWEKAGGLDALINNASIFTKDTLTESTETKLHEMFEINTLAPIHLTRVFARLAHDTKEKGYPGAMGHVVNILDQRITTAQKGCLPYALSKRSLADFTELGALELAPDIRVNAVAPGAVIPPDWEDEKTAREATGAIPLGIRSSPAEVADAVAYLLGTTTVTGQILFVDGGQHVGAWRTVPHA